jgi:geranylgeranyl transferase type-2 subunit alpha
MHGVRKVKTSEDKERERKAENRKTIEKYTTHLRAVLAKHAAGQYDEDGLRESAQALAIGPDSNLLWNYRKRALLALGADGATAAAAAAAARGAEELKLLEQCILLNTKSYWVWYHRRWVGEQ